MFIYLHCIKYISIETEKVYNCLDTTDFSINGSRKRQGQKYRDQRGIKWEVAEKNSRRLDKERRKGRDMDTWLQIQRKDIQKGKEK